MLIHTSHLTSRVDYLADKIDKFLSKQKKLLLTDYRAFQKFKDAFLKIKSNALNPIYNEQFGDERSYLTPEEITVNDIISILNSETQPLEVVSYHSSKMLTNSEGETRPLKHNNRNLKYRPNKYKK